MYCVHIYMHRHLRVTAYMQRSDDNLLGSVLSFHHVGRRDGTQIIRLGNKYLDPLRHLTALILHILPGAFHLSEAPSGQRLSVHPPPSGNCLRLQKSRTVDKPHQTVSNGA